VTGRTAAFTRRARLTWALHPTLPPARVQRLVHPPWINADAIDHRLFVSASFSKNKTLDASTIGPIHVAVPVGWIMASAESLDAGFWPSS
jgi:hypothetical protein